MNPYNDSNKNVAIQYQDNTSFRATFHDGYIFRNLIEYIKKCNQHANIVFSKNEISFSEMNNNGTILNEFKIYTSSIVEYEYKSDNEYYMVSLDVNSLFDHLKSVAKKNTLRIFKLKGKLPICFQKISSYRQNPPNGSMLAPLINNNKIFNYIPPKFTTNENNPTCKVPIDEFYDECKKLKDQKYESVIIRGSEKGISIFANSESGSRTSTNLASFGTYVQSINKSDKGEGIESNKEKDKESDTIDFNNLSFDFDAIDFNNLSFNNKHIDTDKSTSLEKEKDGVVLHIKTIQSFMVLKSISGNGIIKFYFEKLPHKKADGTTVMADTLKCIINIGTCGILRTYVRSFIP